MSTGTFLELAFILLLVMLRLLERSLDRSITPFDPNDKRRRDYRLPLDRNRDRRAEVGKTTYDPIAEEILRRSHDRRSLKQADNGLRRRKSDAE